MKILVKCPTFKRPKQFFSTLYKYYKMAKNYKDMHFLITLEDSDSTMNNESVIKGMESYPNLTYIFGKSDTKIQAVNRDMETVSFNWDILLLASDDMVPVVAEYDEIIRNDMKNNFSDLDGILWYNDGYQKDNLNTLSIMGKTYYERFNYIYYPEYKSVWADNEFMEVGKLLNRQTYFDRTIIEHQHPDWGYGKQDTVHELNVTNENWDHQLFTKRKKQRFKIKKLTILICSLNRRKKYLERLIDVLRPQINSFVEVLCSVDNGELSIGKKRQTLLERATGEYVCFIDDDDLISSNYISLILNAIETKPDVVGMHLIMKTDGKLSGKTYHSLKYNSWYDEPGESPSWRFYYRNPNHLNPVKRKLALEVGYPDISLGEDRDYSMRLLPLLKTESYIDQSIYTYEVRSYKEV